MLINDSKSSGTILLLTGGGLIRIGRSVNINHKIQIPEEKAATQKAQPFSPKRKLLKMAERVGDPQVEIT